MSLTQILAKKTVFVQALVKKEGSQSANRPFLFLCKLTPKSSDLLFDLHRILVINTKPNLFSLDVGIAMKNAG